MQGQEFAAMEGVASRAPRPARLRARPWDALLVAFFALHILTTVLVDAQLVLPAERFPAALQSLVRWHVATYKDFLVGEKPLWFVSLVWCEVLFQLPFYVVAVYAFLYERSWIRVPAIVYAAHTATTMVPILTVILCSSLSRADRLALTGVYLPFLVLPLLVLLRIAPQSEPFAQALRPPEKED